jgi:hypothetical protein
MMGSRFSAMASDSRFLKTPGSPPRSAGSLSPVSRRRRRAGARDSEQRGSKGPCRRPNGGRAGFFLHSEDFWTDYERLRKRGLKFLETPLGKAYGLVAVILDPWGGKWDLLQPASGASETR